MAWMEYEAKSLFCKRGEVRIFRVGLDDGEVYILEFKCAKAQYVQT